MEEIVKSFSPQHADWYRRIVGEAIETFGYVLDSSRLAPIQFDTVLKRNRQGKSLEPQVDLQATMAIF